MTYTPLSIIPAAFLTYKVTPGAPHLASEMWERDFPNHALFSRRVALSAS
jgi:hypothetical protein